MYLLLALTIILECAALLLLKERDKAFYLYWISITTFTNLLVNMYLVYLFSGSILEYWIAVVLIEITVFLVEFLLCFFYTSDLKKSALYSGVCNGASFFIGLVLQLIFI